MKSLFGKKNKAKQVETPRSMDEIRTAYNEVKLQLADSQYQVFVHTETAKELNYRMLSLNKEASARQELDKAAEAAKPKEK